MSHEKRYDPDLAGSEGEGDALRWVPLEQHESFRDPETLSDAEMAELHLRRAALRIVSGLDDRPVHMLARELEVSESVLKRHVEVTAKAMGVSKFMKR